MMDVSNDTHDTQLSLDVGVSWILKDVLDLSFAGITLAEQNGVWQLHLG